MSGAPSIRERAAAVLDRMARAAARAGRRPEEIRLVAVSKTQGAEAVAEAHHAGLSAFGENYVQEAEEKVRAVPGAEWHLIGKLQRNKAGKAVALFSWIETVDSAELVADLSRRAAAAGKTVDLLVEVNVAGEGTKGGVAPDGIPAILEAAAGLPGIRMRGLMAIPPFSEDPEASRPHFARLRALLADAARRTALGTEMTELSMGMSHDFEAAIEEGATIVRVGTAIFGPRRAR